MSEVNTYTIKVTITDSTVSPSFTFLITVTNEAPILTAPVPVDITVNFGSENIYTLPTSMDPEG